MSWFNVWEGLKTKTCRYLLQRYLGQFLENPLNLEQLKVELHSGKATVKNVALKVEALNELFEEQGWSVELQSGHIGQLTVTVPWNSLITNDSSIEITDFEVTLRPIKRVNDVVSMLESMWSSVSSSMQMAEECMRQTDENPEGSTDGYSNAFVGLEKFAETIDNVLNRIKAKFVNCKIRLEYPTSDGLRILALIAHIKEFNYKNETGSEKHFEQFKTYNSNDDDNDDDLRFGVNNSSTLEQINLKPTFAKHFISLNGVQLFTEENMQAKSKHHIHKCKSMEIPVLSITKEQRIQIKVKQTEDVIGPKISLDIELGAIAAFCTPRQVHLLVKILEAFNEEDDSNIHDTFHSISKHKEKYSTNNTANNYNFEKDNMTGMLHNMSGRSEWKNDVEMENIFATRKSQTSYSDIQTTKTNTCQLRTTAADFYCDSITSSMTSSSTMTKSVKLSKRASNMENSVEILNFNAKILSISIALLHEDIILESDELYEETQNEQYRLADKFLSQIYAENYENDEHTIAAANLCTKHCLFFQLLPIIINGVEQRNKNILVFKFSLTATKVDAYEILNKIISTIIRFDRAENCSEGFHKRPELSIVSKSTYSSLTSDYKTNFIDITLDRLTFDLDITIYERLINILAPSPYSRTTTTTHGQVEEVDRGKSKKPKTEININSDELFIILRIPIADTRPSNDPNRLPWWHRNVRDDFFYFSFNHFFIKVVSNIITVSSNEIEIYYCERNDTNNKMHLVTVGTDSDENVGSCPEISIKVSAANPNKRNESCIGPFSSDRVCRQSDTAHAKRDAAEYETLVLPGETHEIKAFCDSIMSSSEVQIKINLPTVDILLQSKLLFEIIYNRLVSDFLMWEPRTALGRNEAKRSQNYDIKKKETLLMSTMLDSIYVSATGEGSEGAGTSQYKDYDSILNDSINDEEETKTDDGGFSKYESVYISTNETIPPKNTKNILDEFLTSVCSVELKIGKGCLALIMPVRDNNSHVLPGQLGKLNILIKNLELFTVTGCNNDDNLGYVCLQLSDIEAYHCGLLPFNYTLGDLKLNARIEEFMKAIFYKLPKGLAKGELAGSEKREMIALVIEIKKKPLQRVKRLKISTGIQLVTIRHLPDMSTCSWLNQLIDFFDVLDYPIDGYTPYGVVTEMQLHFWDCAIDYRPLKFPFRAVMEIGSFTLSSNIISAVVGCNMRLVLEDSTLSIAPNDFTEEQEEREAFHKITFLPSTNLVPVLDLGLLDISLRLSNGATDKQPLCDVRCSIHDVHFRTCADSGHALGQLIVHIANESVGLDNDDTNNMDSSAYSDANSILSTDLVEDEQAEKVTEQQQRVNQMMADAVQESKSTGETRIHHQENESEFEVYFFPDEASNAANVDSSVNKTNADADIENFNELKDILNFESNVMMNSYYIRETSTEDPLPQVKSELGAIKNQLRNASNLDIPEDIDFCVIRDEEKSYLEKCGITNLDIPDDPLRIVDNHFCIPTIKTDLLRAPETFPTPEKRYTLCEMTFTWHLYGGFDFDSSLNCNKSKTKTKPETAKTKMSDAYKAGVAYSKSAGGVKFLKKPKEKLTWKNIGGPGREHSVLVEMQFSKVRLTHEVYPLTASHASRQVLVICDIEIRDRLQSSEINKFLYHPHTKNSLHNKSSENILIVKALHVRPNPQKSLAEECSLRISMLPLRLHIDQETLVFLIEYFSNLGDKMYTEEEATNKTKSSSDHAVVEPMMSVDDIPEAVQNLQARRLVNENLDLLIEQDDCIPANNNSNSISKSSDTAAPTYFREVIFSPEVPICFDYHGRKVELSRGPIAGLLMGLFQLQCSEIRLRKLVYRRGLLGVDKLFAHIFRHWLQDIKRNQLPKILRGVGPTNALVQLFQGVYDLFWLPIEQYQRDGRIIRGLQLGAQSFSARTALAALEITSRIIQLLQYTAETAFDMVSPGPSVRRLKLKKNGRKKRPNRPKDLREGVTNALYIVKEGINESANNLIETAVAEHEQKGYTGAVGAVVRQIPQLVVCPAVLATQATTNILGGVKSSLVPEAKIEAREKWKDESE